MVGNFLPMVADDPLPDGPRRVGHKQQVSIPLHMLQVIGVEVGDQVWIMLNPDRPGTLLLIPRSMMSSIVEKGWTALS
jgi:hypothetical protein